jgi:3-hydroxy-9,10-secoandrosta-1,3,5(10)-triene-9,17-dione monooxygenase reductase component
MTDMIDSRAYRHTVGHFATGVTVIATGANGTIRAMTANPFTSVSLDPPLVLFCVKKNAHFAQALEVATGFVVNILGEDQQPLSIYFAGAWKESSPPPFAFETWEGLPRLEGCIAALGCSVDAIHEGGDHWIVVGRVQALYRSEPSRPPLLFCSGKYGALGDPVVP